MLPVEDLALGAPVGQPPQEEDARHLELGAVGHELVTWSQIMSSGHTWSHNVSSGHTCDLDEDVLPGELLGDVAPGQGKVQVGGLEVRERQVEVGVWKGGDSALL